MNPKRTAILWFAGGLVALALVIAFEVVGVLPLLEPGETIAVAAVAGAASAVLGERLHLVDGVTQ